MYLIDGYSKILWKTAINEKIISDVQQIDFYKNKKYQYIFNTENYIYIIDRNGKNLEGYPLKLKNRATNGITVLDYEENKDYRFVIASGNKIYNFSQDGKPVKGWNIAETKNKVIKPVQYIKNKDTDYLIVTDIAGNVTILNRKGERNKDIKEPIVCSVNNCFYTGNFEGIFRLITTGKDGKVINILQNGDIETTFIKEFSPSHYFLYYDINNDNLKDYIYLDSNKLYVYNQDKEPIFEYLFQEDITIEPSYIKNPDNNNLIAVVSDKTKEIFLFDKEGNLTQISPLFGESPVCAGSIFKDSQFNLISGSGKSVFCYIIE
jgi:hypothetical protein